MSRLRPALAALAATALITLGAVSSALAVPVLSVGPNVDVSERCGI